MRTDQFANTVDYREAHDNRDKGYVFMGHLDNLSNMRRDVSSYRQQSRFYGCVLCPEAREEPWTYDKNMAFWAGIIDAQRILLLVSDIEHYRNIGCGTVDELFWLQDNGYAFKPDPKNPSYTLATPPNIARSPGILADYRNGYGTCAGCYSVDANDVVSVDAQKLALLTERLSNLVSSVVRARPVAAIMAAPPTAAAPGVGIFGRTRTSEAASTPVLEAASMSDLEACQFDAKNKIQQYFMNKTSALSWAEANKQRREVCALIDKSTSVQEIDDILSRFLPASSRYQRTSF